MQGMRDGAQNTECIAGIKTSPTQPSSKLLLIAVILTCSVMGEGVRIEIIHPEPYIRKTAGVIPHRFPVRGVGVV